ncbi:cytochrome c oxidase subunit 3 family protein [Desulfuromonas carbonis]|uniref:cytochrome c oxidase subunit 3 n=1 Tax=Desulfuromonas sp. DDH964 TaxID=1823759 RepID=UPI00078CD894|nr:cytochrome c oxidase subunit 3 [Desulfuromonas sp. DDH964]AMV73317.1 cytochrome c oxidase, coo3-type, subunit III [Desulfuromonas sp. DDH964]
MSSEHRDDVGARLGMWLFLYTEVLLFGGLFILYAIYLHQFEEPFANAAHHLNLTLGTINTVILLTGSYFVAMAVSAVRRNRTRLAVGLLLGGVGTGGVFLFNKYLEWSHEIHNGIYPGSPKLLDLERGEAVFYGLYYVTLGLHGLHVLIGSTLLGILAWWVHTGKVNSERFVALENGGLYWHLVDLVWIFIFPLYYLLL